jgi:hypothetical protein
LINDAHEDTSSLQEAIETVSDEKHDK